MQEYSATVAPRWRGSATISTPEVRLEKLPWAMKPAAIPNTRIASYGSAALKPTSKFTTADGVTVPEFRAYSPNFNPIEQPIGKLKAYTNRPKD